MRLTVIAFTALLLARPALAQTGGHIGLYSDNDYSDCNLQETLGETNAVYVVHVLTPEANAAQFKVVDHWSGSGVMFTGVTYNANLYLGDMFTGIIVNYVGCKPIPYLIATLSFIPVLETSPCMALEVVADPAVPSGHIEVVDCSGTVLLATGGALCVNIPWCCAISGPQPVSCAPVAAESPTWGGIKALYR